MEGEQQFNAVPSSAAPSAGAPVAASSSMSLLTGIGALVVLAAVGVGGYFLFFTGKEMPSKVIQKMYTAMAKVQRGTSSFDVTFNWKVPVASPAEFQKRYPMLPVPPEGGTMSAGFGIKATGATDSSQEGNEQSEANAKLSLNMSGVALQTDIDTRSKGDIIYVRMNEVPVFLDAIGLSSLRGKWIKIDFKELWGQLGAMAGRDSTFPGYEAWKKSAKKMNTTALELILKHPVLVVTEELADDRVNGVTTHHYKLKIDNAHLRAYLKEVLEATTRLSAESAQLDAKTIEERLATLRKDTFPDIDQLDIKGGGEIWIGKSDALLYKLMFTPDEMTFDDEGTKVTATGTFALEAKDYGKSLTVEEPKDVITLEQILGPLFQSMMQPGNDL